MSGSTRIPRLPVLGPTAFSGPRRTALPCLLDQPGLLYTTSGRASILLALHALGVGAGDVVLIPTYHCPTMVEPVVHLGAKALFFPIDASGAPVLGWLQALDTARVKAIVVPHYFGIAQPMAAIRRWCDERRVALVEDCAHALFGTGGGRPVGSWGDMAIGSLTKFLPLSLGGCLVSRTAQPAVALSPPPPTAGLRVLIDAIETAALHGRWPLLGGAVTGALAGMRRLRGGAQTPPSVSVSEGRADAISAAGSKGIDAQLAHQALPAMARWAAQRLPRQRIVERRRQVYQRLAQRLVGHPGLWPLMPELPAGSVPYVFPLWVVQPDPGYARLREMQMPVSRWDWLWPGVPTIEGDQGLQWSVHVLQLACHQDLSDDELERFAKTLIELFGSGPVGGGPSGVHQRF